MNRVLLLISAMILSLASYAQYNETIRTGRPGHSIGPFTVGKGIFQIQTGMDIFGFENKSAGFKGDGFLNNTVLRYGIAEKWEISALADYKVETLKSDALETDLSGLAAFDIGGRYHIYTGEGLIPSVGFQLRFRLPVLSEDYEIDHVAPRFTLITSQKLSDTFTLFTNWGGKWNGNNSTGTGFYTINLAFPLCGKLGGFVENYGSLTNGNFDSRFDTGLSYLVTNDLQLDVLGGPGSNDGVKDFFLSVGLSWRSKR
ncbi:MAG: transporter [Cyclobacteriaceae bacterium]|nr:transporter [Cyclobacteriaceae bacterium]